MGLGRFFTRNLVYEATNTFSGATNTYTIFTDGGPGMYADWSLGEYHYLGGMNIPGAWRAATLLSDIIGGLPWNAFRDLGPDPTNLITPTPPLLMQPCPPDTRMTTFSSLALDLIWEGNAIALIAARNASGFPTAILPIPARWVHVRRVQQADISTMQLPIGEIIYQIANEWYPASEVIHIKGPCRPGALRGTGVLENHLPTTLTLATELERQAGNVGKMGVPSGVLKSSDPDMTPDDAAALKVAWLANQRDKTIAVLNDTTDFTPLAWNPTETQLIEARKFSLHEIALIFGLDPSWLGVSGASMTYSNIEQEAINLIKFSVGGHLSRFEGAFTNAFPRGTQAKANLDSLLRSDTLTRFHAHEIGIRAGFLTRDEARALEDRPKLTEAQKLEFLPPKDPNAPADSTVPPMPPEAIKGNLTSRAADPGNMDGARLKEYWITGEGRQKWIHAPHRWTTLRDHLLKYLPPGEADRTAAQWFHEALGFWPGDQKGKNPVGHG
jgi:HK97 family phage portal protein